METSAVRSSRISAGPPAAGDAAPSPPLRMRAWHWADLAWGLAVVAASGSGSLVFLIYPVVVASLRAGAREGAAVTFAALAGGGVIGFVEAYADGSWSEWQGVVLRAAALAALAYAVAVWVASERAQKQQLRMLAELAGAAERRQISLDLHDGALQPYLGLKLGLEALCRKVEPGNPLAHDIEELHRMTQESISDLRGYVRALDGRRQAPTVPLRQGLTRQVERFERFYGYSVDLAVPAGLVLDDGLAAAVLQMVGEGLSNVGRHTDARRATVSLVQRDEGLVVEIANDRGGGDACGPFTPASLVRRAQQLGGRVEVDALADGATVVRILIPLG